MSLSLSAGEEVSPATGLDVEQLKQYLPGLVDFAIDEQLAETYIRFRATHAEAGLPVWVHHFRQVEESILNGLAANFESLKSLQDPAFLRPLGNVPIDGGLLLVTDAVVDGNRLDTLLREVDPIHARNWAGDLSRALGVLHEQKLIHGRLCPQAIYMTAQGPKILGAGYADLWVPVWEAMDESGDYPPRLFTSLEVRLDGVTDAGVPADVLSVGTILYRGYTGGFPGEFCPLPSDKAEVPRSVDGAVMIAMHPEAASRQQSMEEFIDEFTGVRVRDHGKWEPRMLADNLSTGPRKKTHWLDGKADWVTKFHLFALGAVILGFLGWKGIEMIKKTGDADPAAAKVVVDIPEPEPEEEPEVVLDAPTRKLLELLMYADLAAGQEEWFLEYEALSQALQIAPYDEIVTARIDANPWKVRLDVRTAIDLLKLSNPRQTEWQILADFEPRGCRLDLSGNKHLKNISSLGGLRLQSLDLSGTNVVDLSPLVDSPPRELRARGLPVGDNILGFDPKVTTITTRELPFPSPGQCWESPTGLRFAPILDGRVLLAETEVTRRLFEKFASEDEGLGQATPMQNLQDGKWVKLGHNWRRPGREFHPDEPIVGVTREEAERFCQWLTLRDRNTGKISREETYRLPTDYEWGVAAGVQDHPMLDAAGRTRVGGKPAARDQLRIVEGFEPREKLVANRKSFSLSPVGKRVPVGAFHDLWGNAREWVTDVGPEGREVARGGIEGRMIFSEGTCREDIGFRVILDLGGPEFPDLDKLVRSKAWQRAREVALADAFHPKNPFAREAGRAFLQARERLESDQVEDQVFTQGRTYFRYQLVRLPMDWEQAKKFAKDAGGNLASADDPRLLFWLSDIGNDQPTSIWLGASRSDRGWIWEDGETPGRVTLPETESTDDRLLLTTDRALEASPTTERHAFVIEWDNDREPSTNQEVAQGAPDEE